MDIRYDLYKTFYYVALTGSFSSAADKLFISQSAVSQSIKSLEEQLHTPLFTRQHRNISLTYEGQILYRHVEPAFHLLDSGEKKLQGIKDLEMGEIRIGISDTLCKYYLLPILQQYHRLFPKIKFKIINRTSIKCVKLLKDGQVDFIITNMPNKHLTPFMETQTLLAFRDLFVASHHFLHLHHRTLPLYKLEKLPLIMLEKPTSTRAFIDDYLANHGISYEAEIELTSIDLMMEFAKSGLGITCVPDFCIKKDDSLIPLTFEEALPERHLALAVHKNLSPSFTAKHFMKFTMKQPE